MSEKMGAKAQTVEVKVDEEQAEQLIRALQLRRLRTEKLCWMMLAIIFPVMLLMTLLNSDSILSWLIAKVTDASYSDLLEWATAVDAQTLVPALFATAVGFVLFLLRDKEIAGSVLRLQIGPLVFRGLPTIVFSFQIVVLTISVLVGAGPVRLFELAQGLMYCAYGYLYTLVDRVTRQKVAVTSREMVELEESNRNDEEDEETEE